MCLGSWRCKGAGRAEEPAGGGTSRAPPPWHHRTRAGTEGPEKPFQARTPASGRAGLGSSALPTVTLRASGWGAGAWASPCMPPSQDHSAVSADDDKIIVWLPRGREGPPPGRPNGPEGGQQLRRGPSSGGALRWVPAKYSRPTGVHWAPGTRQSSGLGRQASRGAAAGGNREPRAGAPPGLSCTPSAKQQHPCKPHPVGAPCALSPRAS